MTLQEHRAGDLAAEHRALVSAYGRVQARCSAVITAQAREIAAQAARIEALTADAIRLRAAVMLRDTALDIARQQRRQLEDAIPGLPRRIVLARKVEWLVARVQDLMRERLKLQHRPGPVAEADLRAKAVLCIGQDAPGAVAAQRMVEDAGGQFMHHDGLDHADSAALEASLVAADLVICQTGCVSHDAYWRVQDHCKRTGKTCVLVEQPQAMLFVRHAGAAPAPAREAADAPGA